MVVFIFFATDDFGCLNCRIPGGHMFIVALRQGERRTLELCSQAHCSTINFPSACLPALWGEGEGGVGMLEIVKAGLKKLKSKVHKLYWRSTAPGLENTPVSAPGTPLFNLGGNDWQARQPEIKVTFIHSTKSSIATDKPSSTGATSNYTFFFF